MKKLLNRHGAASPVETGWAILLRFKGCIAFVTAMVGLTIGLVGHLKKVLAIISL